jgi:hypothetical protein
MFEDFIAQLLHHCGRYPELKSVPFSRDEHFVGQEVILG